MKSGGRVLLTGMSGIDPEKGFVFDVGAKWEGHSPYKEGDYLLPAERAPRRPSCTTRCSCTRSPSASR